MWRQILMRWSCQTTSIGAVLTVDATLRTSDFQVFTEPTDHFKDLAFGSSAPVATSRHWTSPKLMSSLLRTRADNVQQRHRCLIQSRRAICMHVNEQSHNLPLLQKWRKHSMWEALDK
jgi:hypothetical protein